MAQCPASSCNIHRPKAADRHWQVMAVSRKLLVSSN